MIKKRLAVCLYILCLCLFFRNALAQGIKVSYEEGPASFPLVALGASSIYVDPAEATVVKIAADALAKDIEQVSDVLPSVKQARISGSHIIIGTIGKSKLLNDLAVKNKVNFSSLSGKWESFQISVLDNPLPGVPKALVIVGSDRRGTAFGALELSKLIGVQPFTWWADIHPEKHKEIYVSGSYTSEPPSVKYRGIFLNDEDWGLQPWAAKTFEPETGDIGPKTYAKIFELLLRLKANLIWPAMHPSTKAFYHFPGNIKVADDYAIIIGSSHAEPMLRNNVGEWDEKTMGHFNYLTNKPVVFKYWEDRVKQNSKNEVIYTMGMRGVHDSGIEGVKTSKEAVPLLERIMQDQRGLISQYINKDVTAVPQVFTAYKEVLDIYDNGLKVPEDVTLIWPDDNYGYIQRLNNTTESNRAGGSGVYYHASYWGRPHDYLWLSSTHPALIREEMMKAYETKSNRLWVLNVGDIKPLEYNIQMFMDMAYRAAPFSDPSYTKTHLQNWASSVFGDKQGPAISNILGTYYDLAFERRPEFMGWSQTEPTTQTRYSDYNHFYYGDEAQKRLAAYQALEESARKLKTEIAAKDRDAFYQLVYYPVVGASNMNKKFLYRDKSFLYAQQNRLSASDYANLSKGAYDSISAETKYYNELLSEGKWKNMMPMAPRDLPVYKAPVFSELQIDKSADWGIAPEGWVKKDSSQVTAAADKMILPDFNSYANDTYFIDVFLSNEKNLNWTAETKEKWIKLSQNSGTLSPDPGKNETRLWVSIDPAKLPAKERLKGAITFKASGKKIKVEVPVFNPQNTALKSSALFVENKGLVAFRAASFNRKSSSDWAVVPGLGRSGNAVQANWLSSKVGDPNPESIKSSPVLEYDFYSFNPASPVINVFTLPTHPLNKQFSDRFAIAIDNGPLQILDFKTVGRSEEWKQNVLQNQAVKKFKSEEIPSGKHTLKIYKIDPGVAIDRIVIDLGGMKKAYSEIPESNFRISNNNEK